MSAAYLLRYVFQPRIMTQDKLFGAAAALVRRLLQAVPRNAPLN